MPVESSVTTRVSSMNSPPIGKNCPLLGMLIEWMLPAFQKWKAELKVSQSYVEPSGFIRAKEINSQYDFSGSTSKSSILNFLKLKGIWS